MNYLKAGTQDPTPLPNPDQGIDPYIKSMADDMEVAFKKEWKHIMGGDQSPKVDKQLQLMFIAVAQGVVRHLIDNKSAFEVNINSGDSAGTYPLSKIRKKGKLYQ